MRVPPPLHRRCRWTRVLAARARQVLAIDPAALQPEVLALPSVVHLRQKAEEAILTMEPHGVREGACDLVVCDANLDALLTCRALLMPMAPLLAPGAGLVLTLKLPRRCSAGRVAAIASDCEVLLRPAFEAVRVEHLFANTGNERTLLAHRRAQQAA